MIHSLKRGFAESNRAFKICHDQIKARMIATIAVIAAIAEKKKLHRTQRSYGNHSSAMATIAATTIAEIEKVLSQRSLSLRSLESGFHMIAELSDRSDHMETGLNLSQ